MSLFVCPLHSSLVGRPCWVVYPSDFWKHPPHSKSLSGIQRFISYLHLFQQLLYAPRFGWWLGDRLPFGSKVDVDVTVIAHHSSSKTPPHHPKIIFRECFMYRIASGKPTVCYGKSPCFFLVHKLLIAHFNHSYVSFIPPRPKQWQAGGSPFVSWVSSASNGKLATVHITGLVIPYMKSYVYISYLYLINVQIDIIIIRTIYICVYNFIYPCVYTYSRLAYSTI